MSTPEHTPDTTELDTRRRALAAVYAHTTEPTRATRAISWAGWHLGEIAGVTVPLGLALTVWDGFYAFSGVAAVCWAVHEVRLQLKQRAIRAAAEAKEVRR
ncbi:hypothetical protein SAMN05421835_110177 [Amycolatopsis sacchari]|uniref:Uncharacterized protein n=1 Tax=Amycolatopsis sacchari TaxID=115433 RepID=A0A1I3V896_9PSEU|nr:hypothetical protein [Amycolatopsis sacchari]SFJ91173.1 hypothetical protein SAMN05421835_110177 [Amycolatopsis sacchari]